MEAFKKEFSLVIKELEKSEALKHIVLVGSWSLYVYRNTILKSIKTGRFTTNDIDFSIIRPHGKEKESVPKISSTLENLGYDSRPKGFDGGQKFVPNPTSENQLLVEFLCPFGRFVKKPYFVNGLGVIATPLRFQSFLVGHTVKVEFEGVDINLPEPAYWSAHKIAISQLREGRDSEYKMMNDIEGAYEVVNALGDEDIFKAVEGEGGKFKGLFKRGWRLIDKMKISFEEENPLF